MNALPTAVSGARTLHRLVYASRVRLSPSTRRREVDAIIEASVANNRLAGITGLLLVHDDTFLQVLEGPAEPVMQTYGRITRDRRHFGQVVLHAGPTREREFADWHMCARHITEADAAIVETVAVRDDFSPAGLSGDKAMRLLRAVRGIQRRLET